MTHFPHNGVDYIKADIIDSKTVITDSQLGDLQTKLLSNGECLQNALTTAKMINSQCVEGFVYCMAANGKKVDEYVIRHCWNFINGVHFDITKDFVWDKVTSNPKDFIYFIVAKYNYDDYFKIKNVKSIDFLSIAPRIAKEINDLLKGNN
jgi:hypothetical protein